MTRIFVLRSAVVSGRALPDVASSVRQLRGSHKILPFQEAMRVALAITGTLPVALVLSGVLALVVPAPMTSGLRIGSYALMPIWCSAAGFTFLRERAREAWASLFFLAALAALLGALVLMLEHALTHGA